MIVWKFVCKYPKAPDEDDPRAFPTISNQKYNSHLKEVGKLAGMTGDWIPEKQRGRTKTREVCPKYKLLTSHVARRTFVTMCLSKGMSPEDIRAVSGHDTALQSESGHSLRVCVLILPELAACHQLIGT